MKRFLFLSFFFSSTKYANRDKFCCIIQTFHAVHCERNDNNGDGNDDDVDDHEYDDDDVPMWNL